MWVYSLTLLSPLPPVMWAEVQARLPLLQRYPSNPLRSKRTVQRKSHLLTKWVSMYNMDTYNMALFLFIQIFTYWKLWNISVKCLYLHEKTMTCFYFQIRKFSVPLTNQYIDLVPIWSCSNLIWAANTCSPPSAANVVNLCTQSEYAENEVGRQQHPTIYNTCI